MRWMWTTAFVVAVSAAVGAQSDREMNEPKMGGQLSQMSQTSQMSRTYTGCIEAVNHGGLFLLTHVNDDHPAMTGHDGMMKADTEMAKRDEPVASNEMPRDRMMSTAVVLTGRSDLKKHVGQKVTVTGSLSHGMSEAMPNDRDTLTVASLKLVAKSCS